MSARIIFYSLSFFFCFVNSQLAHSQTIEEPCARFIVGLGQDSLSWQGSPCAGFGGYVILGTTDINLGFTALDTLTSPSASLFANNNPSEAVWFYRIAMLCNGSLTATTPIINNQRPICPDLRNVSIIGGVPVVSWNASPSPEVIGYQLYKEIPYGSGDYFPYPSAGFIINGLSYNDVAAGSDLLVRYAIVAVSPCNKSLLGEGTSLDGTTGPHSSMVITGSLDTCARRYQLQWNGYENWEFGVQHYEIWMNRNGNGWQSIDTTTLRQYTVADLQDGDNLVFRIRAAELGLLGNYAVSNELGLVVSANRPMDFSHLTQTTTSSTDLVQMQWEWDLDTDFEQAAIETSPDKENWTNLSAIATLATNNYTDATAQPQTERRYYRLAALDACGNTVYSNYGSNFVMRGLAKSNFENRLSWQPVDIEYATVIHYKIYKIVNGNTALLATMAATDTVFLHSLNTSVESEANTCYYIVADLEFDFPNGQSHFAQSQSNLICIQQNAVLHFPNALAPDGKNDVFRPVLVFGKSLSQYSLQIFDRYGGLVFESNDYRIGWEGNNRNGVEQPQGVYVYVARFTQPTGEEQELKGSVFLLR